jgi:hypothetical protein
VHVQDVNAIDIDNYERTCKENPEWEAKRIKCWGYKVGAVFIRKFIPNEVLLQQRIDALKIKKGFP